MKDVQTLKGFRDFLPQLARKRQYVINTLKEVFELYGFEPLETPVLEYDEILSGKYGEEGEKLMYRFEDLGKRKVAMRYDQTVPLARVVTQFQNELPLPFKRYQIQNVWRAENTQKGRYREFMQCDIDTVGTSSPLSDAEIIVTAVTAYNKLGFKNIKVLINDRAVFGDLPTDAITVLDKLEKIGEENVCKELVERRIAKDEAAAKEIVQNIMQKKPTEKLQEIMKVAVKYGVKQETLLFSPTLARGLDYYTGLIIEIRCDEYPYGSLGGGGRYDNLIGMFAGRQIPAVGFAFGFDRTIEAMEALNLFPENLRTTEVLVTIFSPDLKEQSVKVSSLLREKKVNTELYLDDTAKLDKQLKYANQKQIPYVVIIGPEEAEKNSVVLKNMQTGEQVTTSVDEMITSVLN